MFLVGCGDMTYDKQVFVNCQQKQVIQLRYNFGITYFVDSLPFTVDSNCQVKIQTEGK